MREERFTTPGPVTLEIRLPAGEVDLETTDGAETHVVLEPLRDNEATLRAIEEARVELRDGNERRRVVVEVPESSRFSFSDDIEVRVAVHSPHGTSVEAGTASADVAGRGRFGTVEVDTASGDVNFDEVEADARVHTASGDAQLRRVGGEANVQTASGDASIGQVAGRTTVLTASGDVEVGEAGSALKVRTASGDQRVGVGGDTSLQSASGDLEVAIRPGTKLWIDAKSASGDVSSELDVGEAPPAGGQAVVGLRATSMSGDIRIRRV